MRPVQMCLGGLGRLWRWSALIPSPLVLLMRALAMLALLVPVLAARGQTLPLPQPEPLAQPTTQPQPAQPQPPTQPPAPAGNRPGYIGNERNPFALTPLILERGRQGQAVTGFQPAESVRVPNLRLRGIVVGRDGRKAALLEVQGMGTFVVREGDRIGLRPAHANAAIRVIRIDRMQVEVEAGAMRQVILVR